MSLSRRLLCYSFVLLLAAPATAAPTLVGDLGDLDAVQFVGNNTYSSKQIRLALGSNLDVLLAGHPAAPFGELLRTLDQKVTDGYLHQGFADVDVAARFDEQRSLVTITIVEGRQFVAGAVEVIGASTIPIDQLKERITTPQPDTSGSMTPEAAAMMPPTQRPIWQVGKPASFAAGHWQGQREPFQKALQSLGYFDATFELAVRAEVGGSATLVVSIRDEGPRARLGEIEVVGNQKNTAEEVIRFLDVSAGTILDADLKSRLEHQLSESARFVRHDVEVITPPFGDAPAILRVKLVEYADAPGLNEPLSQAETAMVQLAHRLNTLHATDDDLEFQVVWPINPQADLEQEPAAGAVIGHVDLLISHKRNSCLLRVRAVSHPDRQMFDFWLHLDPSHIAMSSPQHKLMFEAQGVQQCVIGTVKWTAHPPDADGRMSNFLFGVGAKGNAKRTLAPFLLQASAAPVAALREAHVHADNMKFENGVLSIENEKHHLAIAGDSGQLLKFEVNQGPQARVRIKSKAGLYDSALADYKAQADAYRVIKSGDTPVSNVLSFLATCLPEPEAVADAGTSVSIARLFQSLLKRGAFRAFDDLLLDFFYEPEDRFTLPAESSTRLKRPGGTEWFVFLLPAARMILPRPSWAWSISRDYVFARTEESDRSVQAIQVLLTDREMGPIANLAASGLLGTLHPQLRVEFARRGLDRMQFGRFSRDYEPFLSDDSAIGRLALATAQTLQEMDNDEIDAIVRNLPISTTDQSVLSEALRQFPLHSTDSPFVVARTALEIAWEPLIKPRVQALLELLAN